MSKQSTASGGVGLGGFMFLIFLTLKLCGAIGWSCWWVTAPLWLPAAVMFVLAGFCLVMAVVTGQIKR